MGISKARELTRALIDEAQRFVVQVLELCMSIVIRLSFDDGEMVSLFSALRFDNTLRLFINEKHIIRRPHIGQIFSHGNAAAYSKIYLCLALNNPPADLKLRIDFVTRDLFGVLVQYTHGKTQDISFVV